MFYKVEDFGVFDYMNFKVTALMVSVRPLVSKFILFWSLECKAVSTWVECKGGAVITFMFRLEKLSQFLNFCLCTPPQFSNQAVIKV